MAREKSSPQGAGSKKQAVLMVGVVIALVVLSCVGTLYATGALTGDRFGKSVVMKRMTLMDAQLLCDAEARKQLGERIRSIAPDSHSSRYDDRSDRFMIFYTADLYEDDSRRGFPKNYFVNCYTRSDREQISHFEASEDAELRTRVIRDRKGGAFGY